MKLLKSGKIMKAYLIISAICALYLIVFTVARVNDCQTGMLFNPRSFWMGFYYSKFNKRYCLNIIPAVTVWWCNKGGKKPIKSESVLSLEAKERLESY